MSAARSTDHPTPSRRPLLGALAVLAMLTLGVAACGSSSKSSSAVSGSAVAIKNFTFTPANLKAKVGAKVTFTNNDSTTHTITSDSGSAQAYNSGDLSPGKSYSVTYAKAGTYSYHCNIHQYMKGTITVG